MKKIHWGILSTGKIAGSFTEDIRYVPDAEVVAVGSRNQHTAEAFGQKHNIPKRHPSYQALSNGMLPMMLVHLYQRVFTCI